MKGINGGRREREEGLHARCSTDGRREVEKDAHETHSAREIELDGDRSLRVFNDSMLVW